MGLLPEVAAWRDTNIECGVEASRTGLPYALTGSSQLSTGWRERKPVHLNAPPCPVEVGHTQSECIVCLNQRENNSVTMWIALDDCDREVGEPRLGSERIDRVRLDR